MWEISSGQPPFNFQSPEQVISLITNNKREMPIYGTPIKYVSLYRECWQQDPQQRKKYLASSNLFLSILLSS
ncbi:hypothetical protein GLOIN_2v1637312 [Rhizophagus irregularis DAOM 181602=DAOM 197198]|uniref:Serine-threonine/tyrosine-protein kinase catalytic domain-containing protein n=1 Tax=Rhizophagus irregularis (strain DAOM 181602 / DAOM 197198 / MUCL 43194) TaxID=747089 RepID=A0A2P4PSP3_RHIID|nr:hypothetical protein GLOIN_2v1637312 [Rhizophagus irregularis DAOM 181602=DAOM 197198]POG68405.1 hypothetical protein GLOIN_2v1637312 [Rhizophagus irregularis DAOM 181602=DAOM 197198]|eukprot:XP_025175271.1 hypothetical protein GLOIN_2v1637312 [Rhizophagus irregularis DAOM 181602=DAOM 197198]